MQNAPTYASQATRGTGILLNDCQSKLNQTRVRECVAVSSIKEIAKLLERARQQNITISVAGGRHAMGGQQFAEDSIHIDTTRYSRVFNLDTERGLVTVESGIQWPELIDELHHLQADSTSPWTIRQKQSGVDRVSIGGSLSANIHGRGLAMPPFVADIECFEVLLSDGRHLRCSREENEQLFSLTIGGYGLFGIVTTVTLLLMRRVKVRREVKLIRVTEMLPLMHEQIKAGCLYGDCQYSPDLGDDPTQHSGILSCYREVGADVDIATSKLQLHREDWAKLYSLARADKRAAFKKYCDYYSSSNGQVYFSDEQQLSNAFDGYHDALDQQSGTEMITEVYVPPENFTAFMAAAREDFVRYGVDMTYGTIRLIAADTETFLPWASKPLVCIVCNLHVTHTPEGITKAKSDFRRIIDRAIEFSGHYYLTYHSWATGDQLKTCYPQISEFMRLKKFYDPEERFQSEWYRRYRHA